jgi:hypothetical protein
MKHNIITTENYLLVVDDSEIKEKSDDWFYSFETNKIYDAKTFYPTINCKRIIAHLPINSPILTGVDLLPPLEDEVEKLAEEYADFDNPIIPICAGLKFNRISKRDFISGYNKAKEKYKYTEEDLRKAINLAYVSGGGGDTYQECEEFVSEQLESLQQPKMPVGFECEILVEFPIDWDGKGIEQKTITNSQGLTQWVGRYIYE